MPYKDWDNCIQMKDIPLCVIDTLEDYKRFPAIYRVDIRQSTREALWFIKKQNNMTVMCDVIDLLISNVCFSQMSEESRDILKRIYNAEKHNGKTMLTMKKKFHNKYSERQIVVENKRYRSVTTCAEELGVHRKTVEYRLKSLKTRWKDWNYLEDYGQYDNLMSVEGTLGDGEEFDG